MMPSGFLHTKYRPDIDGLRALAVMAVVLFHAFPGWLTGGFVGVDVFFVISGFLISSILFESLDQGTFSFAEFYVRRIKRIFPALLLVLTACYVIGWCLLLAQEFMQLGKHVAAGAAFVSNFVLWGESGYFDNAAESKPLLHLWSLGIEEQFYIFWPVTLWFFWKRGVSLVAVVMVGAAVSFALNIYGVKNDSVATFYLPQTRFWELLCGALLAWHMLYGKPLLASIRCSRLSQIIRIGREICSVGGCILLAYGCFRISKADSFPGLWAIIPVLGAALIIFAGPDVWINKNILAHKLIVFVGLISYPLYLWHWPLLSFARILEGETPAFNVRVAAILLSGVLAWLTYRFVESPLQFSKKNQRVKVVGLIVGMGLIGMLGYLTYLEDGLKFRAAAKNRIQTRENLRVDQESLRQIEIRGGICQFNKTGKHRDIDSFVKNWNCFANSGGRLGKRVLVFGDSHAADKAMGLRLNGIDVVQLGGAGCSINPALATDQQRYCLKLFDLVKRFQSEYDFIVLSNRFPMEQITEENLAQIVSYWRGDKPVYLFTPMADFTDQMREYMKTGKVIAAPDFSREDAFLSLVSKVALPPNFSVIKTSDVWCINRAATDGYPCSFIVNDQFMMVDGEHLSVAGSESMAKNMIANPVLKSLLSVK